MHHGVLGQKWGVRRFQNKDGSLTAQGKAKYRPDRVAGNIGRAITNTTFGQRIYGVGMNKGYRQDRAEIKGLYKSKKQELKDNQSLSKEERKGQLKSLKEDYKKTKGEARIDAADALYPWQTKSQNEKIQTQSLGKTYVKSLLLGNAGDLAYDRLSSNGVSKGKAVAAGIAKGMADSVLSIATKGYGAGVLNIADYAYQATKYGKEHKSDNKVASAKTNNYTSNHSTKLSDSQIKSAVNNAKKTGKMDIDFVEKIQNNERLMNARNDDPKLLAEYEKYLRNK